jgi:4-hydroxy-tetrahydrodipicolinate reductase
MNIALIGYGNMGRIIEKVARDQGHRIAVIVDPLIPETASLMGTWMYKSIGEAENLGEADVAVEFTRPETAAENIRALIKRGIPVVTGTTGWYDGMDEVKKAVQDAGASFLWTTNFSLGVNLFYRIAFYAARLMDPITEYDIAGLESHHNKKIDSPSGTAKILVEGILKHVKRKTKAVYGQLDRAPLPEELHYPSLRVGAAPGTHSLFFDSPADTITISHSARNREGFASGALFAAQWLLNCEGLKAGTPRRGVFTMEDVLDQIYTS